MTEEATGHNEAHSGGERRRYPRIRHSMPVVVEYVMNSGHRFRFGGQLTDISAAGAGVVLPLGFWCPVGRRSRVRITLGSQEGIVEWIGHVARLDKNSEGLPMLGIQFEPREDMIPSVVSDASMSLELVEEAG